MAEIQPNWSQLYSNAGIRFGNNPGLDMLNQRYQQYQQQKAMDLKDFAKTIGNFNFGGVKPADMNDLQQQYSNILGTFNKMRTTQDPKEYTKLNLELQLQKQQMFYDAAQKAEAHKTELGMFEALNHPNSNASENAYSNVQNLVNTPTSSPKYQSMLTNTQSNLFDKPVDTDKIGDTMFKREMDKRVNTGDYKWNPQLQMYERSKTTATQLDKGVIDREWSNYLINNPREAHRLMDKWNIPDVKQLASVLSDNTWEANKGKLHTDVVTEAPKESFGQKERLMEFGAWLKSKYPTYGQSQSTAPTPAQILGDAMKTGVQGSGEKFLSLIPKGTYYEGEKPTIGIDPATGEQIFTFPRQAIKTNGKHRPEATYRLNPNSPDYHAKFAEMAADQHVNLENLNKIEGVKGHGQIPQAQRQSGTTRFKINGKLYDIPADKIKEVKKQYPNAQIIQ